MLTTLLFLIVLAVLIFVHELGHFLVAKAFGIRVDEFALGFGPKLWSIKRGETKYAFNLVPFGGYVKIFGENPDEDSMHGPHSKRSFVNKPKWQQILVLVAGVVFNFIFGWLLISAAFTAGVPASVDSYPQYVDRMTNPHIAITYVEPASPADKAGIKAGDSIYGIATVEDIQNAIADSTDQGISFKYVHDGVEHQQTIVAQKSINGVEEKYAIGIAMDNVAMLHLPIHLAIYESARFVIHMIREIAAGLFDLVIGIFNHTSKLAAVTGPIGIAGLVGDAAHLGFAYLLMFTALISINLGVLNLVPFPALDGGRILFVLIEAIIRRPIKPVVANTINGIGFSLLILLMVIVTYHDIAKLFIK